MKFNYVVNLLQEEVQHLHRAIDSLDKELFFLRQEIKLQAKKDNLRRKIFEHEQQKLRNKQRIKQCLEAIDLVKRFQYDTIREEVQNG